MERKPIKIVTGKVLTMDMTTNPHGVKYRLEATENGHSVFVQDVTTPLELPGFPTRKCAQAFALTLKPIIDLELLRNAQTTL